MFVSTRDQGRRRRSQVYGVNKTAWSSKLSLLSAITATSSNSSGSTSTITQESYTRSRNESKKRRRSSRRKHEYSSPRRSSMDREEKVTGEGKEAKENVDVFAFLVKDEKPDPHSYVEDDPLSPVPGSPVDEPYDFSMRSQHSDSGISMDDSTFDIGEPFSKPILATLHEREYIEELDHNATDLSAHSRWKWPEVPKPTPFMLPPPISRYPVITDPRPNADNATADKNSSQHTRPILKRYATNPELSGYDLIASKLAGVEGSNVPPVFKRFGKVNYRILLMLQDEIVEMEEELAQLDKIDTRSRHNQDGSTAPASRRMSWQWGHSDLHPRRLELLGRLYIKIEQYYQALVSAQKVHKFSKKALPQDIEQFREWLRKRNPLSASESHFLDDDNDLICLDVSDKSCNPPPQMHYLSPVCIALTSIFPLLVFKIVFDILNRLIFVAFLAASATYMVEKIGEKDQRQIQQWMMGCTTISVVAAILV